MAGGTNLIYQAETKDAIAEKKDVNAAMNRMVLTIQKRINPSGTEEMAVRRVGDDRIEIIIPGADQGVVAQKKRDMTRIGSLEFGIVANDRDHRREIAAGLALPPTEDKVIEGNQVVAVWRTVSKGESVPSSGSAKLGIREVFRKDPKTGKRRNLGTFKSLAAAKKHERAVQFFKRH